MQSTDKFYLICIFLCAPFFTKAQLQLADSLFQAGDMYGAKLEYERVIFQNIDSEITNQAILKKSFCYKKLEKYEKSLQNLQRANLFSNNDSLNFAIRREIALSAYLAGEFETAGNQITQINFYVEDTTFKASLKYLEILTLNQMLKWDEAKILVVNYNKKYKLDLNINALYGTKYPKVRSGNKFEYLAAIYPGFVQAREGSLFDGIISSGLRGGALAWGIHQVLNDFIFSGIITGGGLYYVFYTGAVHYALELTNENNQRRIKKYNDFINIKILNAEINRKKY